MASTEHIHVCRERGYSHILPSQISANEYRETNSIARRTDILAPEHRLPGQWARQLRQDSYEILTATSFGTKWMEDTSGLHNCSMRYSGSLCIVSGHQRCIKPMIPDHPEKIMLEARC